MGKSVLAQWLVREEPRLVGFDPFLEHDALSVQFSDLALYLDEREAGKQLDAFRVVTPDEEPEEFPRLCWELSDLVPQGIMVAVEEADLIAPPQSVSPYARKLAAQGRHRGISMLTTSRRPAEVARLLTSQAGTFYVFRIQEPGDLTYLRSVLGDEATVCKELPPYHALHWTPLGSRVVTLKGDTLQTVSNWRHSAEPSQIGDEEILDTPSPIRDTPS